MYLGGLNLAYTELVSICCSLPRLPRLVAVAATPYVKLVPALKVAVTGADIAPKSPYPMPLKKPLAPSYFVFSNGLVKIPVTPPTNSDTPPLTP